MLEPQLYPDLVAKALVLDDEPFAVMHDDDNPWIEGLALIMIVGITAGIAQTIGGWLTVNSLPDPSLVQSALVDGARQLAAILPLPPAAVQALEGGLWNLATNATGYAGGWSSLMPLATTPTALILWWLFFGFVAFGVARALGGHGSLNQTLGATALMVAPQVLLWLSIVPFVAVSGALLTVWGVLIGYRAVQTTHRLSWQRAAVAALAPCAAALVLLPMLATAFALGLTAGGYR